jgi:hypothetical protein
VQVTGVVAVSQPRPRNWPASTRHSLSLLVLLFANYSSVGLEDHDRAKSQAIVKTTEFPTHAPVAGAATSAHFLVASQTLTSQSVQTNLDVLSSGTEELAPR